MNRKCGFDSRLADCSQRVQEMGNTNKLPPVTMTPEVIEAINEELAYQSTLQGSGRADAREHGVEGQLVTQATYVRKAVDAWALSAGDEAALDQLRKVAAFAVRALVQYGCPKRVPKMECPKGTVRIETEGGRVIEMDVN
jgi:hypothetical protein